MLKVKARVIVVVIFTMITFIAVRYYLRLPYKEQYKAIKEKTQIMKRHKTDMVIINPGAEIPRGKRSFYRTSDKDILLFTNLDLYSGEYNKNRKPKGRGLFIYNPQGPNRGKIKNGTWKDGVLIKEKEIFLSEKKLFSNKKTADILSWNITLWALYARVVDLKWNSHILSLKFQNKSKNTITKVDLYIEVKSVKDGTVLQKMILEDAFSGKEIGANETKDFTTKRFCVFWDEGGILLKVEPYVIYTKQDK